MSNGSEEIIKTVAVFEANLGGHYLQYAKLAIKALVDSGYKVIFITLESSFKSSIFKDVFEKPLTQIEIIPINAKIVYSKNSFLNKLYKTRAYLKEIKKILNAFPECEFLFLPFLNHFGHYLVLSFDAIGGLPYGGILLHNFFHMKTDSTIKNVIKENLKKFVLLSLLKREKCKFIGITDPTLLDYLKKKRIKNKSKLYLLNEPGIIDSQVDKSNMDIRKNFRSSMGINDNDLVILVYGVISGRKGIANLINALVEKNIENVKILIAGIIEPDVKGFLNSEKLNAFIKENKIIILDKYLSRNEESKLFSAADVVWVGYLDFYSMSGVLFQASIMQKPIIACRKGLIGWFTEKYDLGFIIDPEDKDQIISVIVTINNDRSLLEKFKKNALALSILHTEEQICTALGKHINSILKK